MDQDTLETLVQGCIAAVGRCLESGLTLPLSFTQLDPQGEFIVGRIDEDRDFEPLAVSSTENAWRWPVNVMFVDTEGRAYRVMFDIADGEVTSKDLN